MTYYQHEFLTREEELSIKSEFINYKNSDRLDKEIRDSLIKLNSLDGFASLHSYSKYNKHPESYLVFKFAAELTYPITEALYGIDIDNNISISWNESCWIVINGETVYVKNVVIIRSNNYDYFESLVEMLID